MQLFYCDHFVLPLPDGHRFPMAKYARLRQRLIDADDPRLRFVEPPAATDAQLGLVHDRRYLHRIVSGAMTAAEQRTLGFPWSPALVERSRRSTGATIAACRAAVADGVAANLAGGTHHAMPAAANGFCVFNDAAVAARTLQREAPGVRHVMIIDLDVHQGNGTAAALAHDDSVFTLSVHGERNYPFRKVDGDLDMGLPDGTGDDAYLSAVEKAIHQAFQRFSPDLIIYLAGADPYEGDRLGRMAVSKQGLAARDALVLERCRGAGLPVAIAMAGGYARDVEDIVDIHAATILIAAGYADAPADIAL